MAAATGAASNAESKGENRVLPNIAQYPARRA